MEEELYGIWTEKYGWYAADFIVWLTPDIRIAYAQLQVLKNYGQYADGKVRALNEWWHKTRLDDE